MENNSWVIANLKHSGFYRVNYDNQNWELLINQLNENHQVIDSISRAQLIDDSFYLAQEEIVHQNIFLRIISYLAKEDDPLPFQAALNALDYIDSMFSTGDKENYEIFKVTQLFYELQLLNLIKNLGIL